MQLAEVTDTRIAVIVDAKPNMQAELWRRNFRLLLEVFYSPVLLPESDYWQAVTMELENSCHFVHSKGVMGDREFFREEARILKYELFTLCPYPEVGHTCPYGRGTPPQQAVPCPR